MESDTQKAEKSPAIPAKRAHALVDELAQLTVQWLRASMEKMFSACDDFLNCLSTFICCLCSDRWITTGTKTTG